MLQFFLALALLSDPSQAIGLLQKGLLALQQGHLTDARSNLEQASRIDESNPYVWSSLAETYQRLKQPKEAASAARNAEKFGSKNPIVCHALAMYYAESGQPAKAAEFESRFAETPQADTEALERAAALYLDAGDTDHALPLARTAVAKNSSPKSEDLLGRALVGSGQLTEGTQHLATAWQSAQADPAIAFDYAQALLRQERFNEAADAINSALGARPDDPQLLLTLGVARYGQRRFEESIDLFLKVIQADATVEQPYLFLGKILDQAGPRLGDVTNDFEKWAKAEPKNPKALLVLAKALQSGSGDPARIEELLKQSVAIDGRNWESHYELGVLLMNKHAYQAAADELSASARLDPAQPTPHYQLARTYDRLGQPEKAKAERKIHAGLISPSRPSANH